MRKDRQVKSSIAPEAASKAPSVPFPSVESGGGDDKTSGSTKELVAGMLDDIARDRADRAKELEKTKDKKEHKLMIKLKPLRPGAQERFTLEIIPDERHATMWDGNDDDMYAWSGTLVVTDTKPPSHIFSMDIIKHLDIRFHAVAEPSAHPELSPAALDHAQYDAWNTRHFGHSIPPWDGTLPTPLPDPSRGIVVERSPKFVEPKNRDGPFTWLVRFWLSIPFALFAHAEHKTFVCQAKAIVQYACSPKTEVKAESISVGIERLRSERLLTVSHNGSGGR
ncbi:hypothetical protein C8Q77DRAFT_1151764 [Trametes polyzona]|nr:hypothetical protein C8Q77DRAFT_1151764 [Trametes polyzona]